MSDKVKQLTVIVGLGIVSILSIMFTFNYAIEFSAFAAGIFKYFMSILLIVLIDRYLLLGTDTLEMVSKEPIAYAIFFLSNCVLLAACISTS